MSRLSAQADMEYLPSYGTTIAGLTRLFDNIGQLRDMAPIRLIDPCAGEGDALRTLADAIRTEYEGRTGRRIAKKVIETYGIELDTERARKARRKLKRVVQTDYFNTLVTPGAFNWRWGYQPQPEYVETAGELTHPKWGRSWKRSRS